MDITLYIPTLNRPEFVLRALSYYELMKFRGKISIGDSSDTIKANKIKNFLPQFSKSLEINYRYLPGCNAATTVKILNEEANTTYATVIGDDDFLVPSGIGKCIEFLDVHPDYVAAHGVGIIIGSAYNDEKNVESVNYYPQPKIEEITAVQRLIAYLTNYSVGLFSVHRIKVWGTMFKKGEDIADKAFGSELLQCCLSAILGKIKQLDGLYLIRQNHTKRYLLPSVFEWIMNEAWYPSYANFRDCLAEEIVCQDGITLEEAKLAVEKAFVVYLAQQCTVRNPPKWSSIAKQIPGTRAIWDRLEPWRNKYCLSNMLRADSPYLKDFMPVYKMITQR